jgi:hypothetical protein
MAGKPTWTNKMAGKKKHFQTRCTMKKSTVPKFALNPPKDNLEINKGKDDNKWQGSSLHYLTEYFRADHHGCKIGGGLKQGDQIRRIRQKGDCSLWEIF